MKILYIHNLGSRTNTRGDYIAKYLAERGHEVHLILWDVPFPITMKNMKYNLLNSLKYKKYNRDKVIIHKIKRLPFFVPIFNRLLFHSQIKKIYKKYSLDIIISESYINETEPPKKFPLIYSLIDDFEDYAKFYGSWFYKLAFKILAVKKTIKNQIKRSKATIVVSDLLINYSKRYNKNIYKIPNGVESWVLTKRFSKKKYNFGKNSLVYVCSFDAWSNLINLLNAIKISKKIIPKIKLVLIGDGYQMPLVKRTIKELGIEDNVKIFGRVENRGEVFEIINSCSVCIALSEKNHRQDSTSPVKIFEYAAMAKPTISTELNEVKNYNFPNIIFYDENNVENLVKAIKKSFTLKVNKTKIKKQVKEYTWENIAKKFEEVIQK